jgi:hypothetical protein
MALAAGFTSVSALAESATIAVSDPTGNGVVTVTVTLPDGTQDIIPISVTNVMSAEDKRDQIAVNLFGRGYDAQPVGPRGVKINGLDEGTSVSIDAGTTGEQIDRVVASAAQDAQVSFAGLFDPIAADGLPADFTAGFVCGENSFLAQVTAEELQFQTDGARIALALFERLLEPASQLGVELELVGDGIRVGFPGSLSSQRGGVVFGTTSLSPGVSGGLLVSQSGGFTEPGQPQQESLALKSGGPTETPIELGPATGSQYCVYIIVGSNCSQLSSGDYVCVNCPDGGSCSNTIAFVVVNGSDVECSGRWGNAHGGDNSCHGCPGGGKKGWRFR